MRAEAHLWGLTRRAAEEALTAKVSLVLLALGEATWNARWPATATTS